MKTTPDDMTTLLPLLEKAKTDGYIANYTITEDGLHAVDGNEFYSPEEVQIDNFYRFEGASDPSDSSILYLLKVAGNNKGTLTDAYGAYANEVVTAFMEQVDSIHKKQKGEKTP